MKPKEYIWMKVERKRRTGEHNVSEQQKQSSNSHVRVASQEPDVYSPHMFHNSTLIQLIKDITSQIDWDTNVKSMAESKGHFLKTLGFLGLSRVINSLNQCVSWTK